MATKKVLVPKKRGPKKVDLSDVEIKQIAKLAKRGLTQEQIIDIMPCGRTTFFAIKRENPYLADVIRKGKSKGISVASGKLMQLIKKGNLQAIIFFLKTQGRWSENNFLNIDPDKMTVEERIKYFEGFPLEVKMKLLSSIVEQINNSGDRQ